MRQKSIHKRHTGKYNIVDHIYRCSYSKVLKDIDEMVAKIKRNSGIIKYVSAFDKTIDLAIHANKKCRKTDTRIIHTRFNIGIPHNFGP
ncbi:hypothetical protein, partial [Loigolactobacillus bifermentans]|uniref:hypothetical protein n=1 Tax=Loigolactobacillus bifermentans TaxID=1607 RepID=UPI001F39AD32